MKKLPLGYVIATIIIASAITYGLAVIGEPQTAWLLCDIFGMEICP